MRRADGNDGGGGATGVQRATQDETNAVSSDESPEQSSFRHFLRRVYGSDAAARVKWAGPARNGAHNAGSGWFELRVVYGDVLEVNADSVLSACSAVNHYCNTAGLCAVSWGQTTPPRLPRPLAPLLDADETGTVVRYAFMLSS